MSVSSDFPSGSKMRNRGLARKVASSFIVGIFAEIFALLIDPFNLAARFPEILESAAEAGLYVMKLSIEDNVVPVAAETVMILRGQ